MASKTLLTVFAVAMVISLASAFLDDDDDDVDFLTPLEEELAKRDFNDFLSLEKRSYPKCRHWFTKALCRCDDKYDKYDERRYTCFGRSRGYNDMPFA
ncbi:uncharacterized protein LOC117301439 [Asterias rubens]|uniref:uncharacterized protein LOC117301439 n=1 Tax=Asterias rubens TaxID=7604 RepID=UPI001454FD24|nr:uncharacterized protein LOC117301439 [Asterias rubens]